MRLTNRTVTDDRGKRHPVTRWMYSFTYPMPWEPIYRETPRSWRNFHKTALVIFAFLLIAVILSNFAFPSSGSQRLANRIWAWFPALMVVWFGVIFYFHFAVFRPWAKRRKLAIGRCRVCDYELTSLTPDPDGCTTCPECGAAWRLSHPLPDA